MIIADLSQVDEKVIFLRMLKNAQMQGSPAFADLLAEQVLWQARAATRRQAKSYRRGNSCLRAETPHFGVEA